MIALATAVQEVFAFSRVLVVVPAWEGALTRSHNWGHSTGICGGAEESPSDPLGCEQKSERLDLGSNETAAFSESLVHPAHQRPLSDI